MSTRAVSAPPAGDLDVTALRVSAIVRLAAAVTAAGYGWVMRGSVDHRAAALFLLAGLVALPWAALLLWASLRRGPLPGHAPRLIVQGGPLGDVLLVFAAQTLLPGAGGVLLLGHALVICLAVSLWPERDAWLLAALSVALTLLAQTLAPAAVRLPALPLALFALVVAGLVVVVDRIVRGHRMAAATSTRFREKADAILSRVADSIVVTDGDGVVLECNPAGARLIGRPGNSAVGVQCSHALGLRVGERALDCRHGCPLLAAGAGDAEGGAQQAQEVWRVLPDGRRQPLWASASAVFDAGGGMEVVHSLRDITRLKEADEAKTLFLATASHELKTPLTVIAGFAEAMLAFPTMSEHRRREALRAIHGRALELGSIVDRLLLSSKLEGGRVKVDLHRLDLRALLAERSKDVQDSTGRHVVMQLAPGSLAVAADANALRTVVDHLLDNAVKYSDGGPVVLGARTDGEMVALWVSDIGIGMDEEQARRCFEKFWQAESTDVRRFGGTGIGLYIVQSMVEAMAGTVTVDTAVGRGSTFTVRLGAHVPDNEEGLDADPPDLSEMSGIKDRIRQIGVLSRGSA